MMLARVKQALRINNTAYDGELNQLIKSAVMDLGVAGVTGDVLTTSSTDGLIIEAVITYCKMRFGLPEDYERLKASYDEQKAQLATCTGYTNWLTDEDEDEEE